jgi:hypothetical protein
MIVSEFRQNFGKVSLDAIINGGTADFLHPAPTGFIPTIGIPAVDPGRD